MKKLVTASDVKNFAEKKQGVFYVEPGTIITPAAKDAASELNIHIEEKNGRQYSCCPDTAGGTAWKSGVGPDLIVKIVKEVMASMLAFNRPVMVKENDPGGLCLVRGNTVVCEKYDTGKPYDNAAIKNIFDQNESPNMSAGFMTFEKTSFSLASECEKISYIIEGSLEITTNGTTYRGEAGDVLYLPGDATVTLYAPGKVKLFFVS